MTHPLRSMGITPLRRYYEAVRPSPAHRYFQPHGWSRLCFSLSIAGQVLTFRTGAWSSFALPTRRMPLGPYQDIKAGHLLPGLWRGAERPEFVALLHLCQEGAPSIIREEGRTGPLVLDRARGFSLGDRFL